jgi:hypothetical protein
MVLYERQTLVSHPCISINIRGESGIGNWTVQVSDVQPSFTGTLHSWQLILWGSSIDPSITEPHPLPGTPNDEGTPTISVPQPSLQPTVSPPYESSTSTPSPLPSSEPQSPSFWPWSSERKMVWIYGSIGVIGFFVSVLGAWCAVQRRKANLIRTHGQGREDYEFEVLPNDGEDGIRLLVGKVDVAERKWVMARSKGSSLTVMRTVILTKRLISDCGKVNSNEALCARISWALLE